MSNDLNMCLCNYMLFFFLKLDLYLYMKLMCLRHLEFSKCLVFHSNFNVLISIEDSYSQGL